MSFQDKDGNSITVGDYVTWDNKIWVLESEMSGNACLRALKSKELVTPIYKNIVLYKKKEEMEAPKGAATNLSNLDKENKKN